MRNLRYTLRFLAAHKSFTAAAVFTLAIGLGANTALFGLLNVVLRPLDVPHAEQLVAIAETRGDESGGFQYVFSLEALYDLQRRATSFSHVFGVMPRIGGLSAESKAAQFFYVAVSDNYFPAIGIAPHLGTLFTRRSGSPAVIVLGYTFWMKHFGGDPAVAGRQVRVNGHPAVVTGVVPEGFRGTYLAVEMDGYVAIEDLRVIDPDVERWLYLNRKPRPMQLAVAIHGSLRAAFRLKPEATLDELTGSSVGRRRVPWLRSIEPLPVPVSMPPADHRQARNRHECQPPHHIPGKRQRAHDRRDDGEPAEQLEH